MADFKLGRLKFKWRGDWSTTTAYVVDDIVKYGGNTYVCVSNHTSQATSPAFYTDLTSAYWEIHTEGLYFKGNWAQSTHYKLNDLVKYGAYQYRTTTQHTSTSSFDSTKFEVYAEGLQWEDTYDPSTVYQDGDVVNYGGYTYVYVNSTPSSGNTPTDNSYWDVVTTGYNNTGTYSHGTSYKTGDVVKYGGNSYVVIANHTNQYPANTDGTTNTSYWQLIISGFNYRQSYNAGTSYNIGDVVLYAGTSYVMLKDRNTGTTPGTDATTWSVTAQGDPNTVLTEVGDIIYNTAAGAGRLDLGPAGAILTSNGTIPEWRIDEGSKNVLYVSNSGNDSNPGTRTLPYKTINAALNASGSGDILDLTAASGGTGGTAGTYDVVNSATSGSGTGAKFRIVLDGSTIISPITVQIVDGGKNYALGDTVTLDTADIGGNSNITLTVGNVGFGDIIWIKGGSYREQLPLIVPAGVSVIGEGLRAVEIRPASGSSTSVATVTSSSTISGATDGTYSYKHPVTVGGNGAGLVVNVTIASNVVSAVAVYHGGYHYQVNDTNTLTAAQIGCGGTGTLTLTVASLENNDASYMFLMNNGTNLRVMTLRGLTGTSTHLAANTAHGGGILVSLDPEGSITTQSPYIQDVTVISGTAVGCKIDGLIHTDANSNKSIVGERYTQINSDGIGIWAHGNGRAEMVSVFAYYCLKSYFATEGGFIRSLNGSSCYGEEGAVADGQLVAETPVNVKGRGEQLKYSPTSFGGGATEADIANMIAVSGQGTATVTGNTSGATATIFRFNTSLDYLYIENRTGNFQQGETVTITKEDSSTFTVDLDASFGDSSAAQQGQLGPLVAVKSGSTALTSTGLITVGSNIKFSGNAQYYRISAVTEEDTANETALVRLTAYVTADDGAIDEDEVGLVTQNFSNIRLTGHDFLSVGTGGFADTNYPGTPLQAADQTDEVSELNGGRVYYVSTDQEGDFRVGDLFRIQQATGVATLNADAFDLSGLSELQLGSIGAELGATINEFSIDQTLSGDSSSAVPTERAVYGFLKRDNMGTDGFVPPTGTTAQRPTNDSIDRFTGSIRWNTDIGSLEAYSGSTWWTITPGNPWQTKTNSDDGTSVTTNSRNFVDTTSGATTLNLPASPVLGDTVMFVDVANNFATNNLTVGRNSSNIEGLAENLTVSTEGAGITLVYSGATYGWKLVNNI